MKCKDNIHFYYTGDSKCQCGITLNRIIKPVSELNYMTSINKIKVALNEIGKILSDI